MKEIVEIVIRVAVLAVLIILHRQEVMFWCGIATALSLSEIPLGRRYILALKICWRHGCRQIMSGALDGT